jgi:hypothetical protein
MIDDRHNLRFAPRAAQWQHLNSTARQASCKNPYVSGSKCFPRVGAKHQGNSRCAPVAYEILSNHIFGIRRAARIQNRAGFETADQYAVDETSGKRALPVSASRVREAQAGHGPG